MDVEAIAKGLTKAQRGLCVSGGDCVAHYAPARALVRLGIWSGLRDDDFTIHADYTPLGQAVAAHLKEINDVTG